MTKMKIPRNVEQVDARWVGAALEQAGVLRREHVLAVKAEPIGVGHGLTGQLARLRLKLAPGPKERPSSVVLKLRAPDAAVREQMRRFDVYSRELRFYREFAGRVSLRVPRVYALAFEPGDDSFALLLEDLGHGRPGDPRAGVTPDEAAAVLERLGRHHGRWWEHPDLAGKEWLPAFPGPELHAFYAQLLAGMSGRGLAKRVPRRLLGLVTGLSDVLPDVIARLRAVPQTLVHADMRLANVIFDLPGDDPVAVLDWQLCARGPAVFDAALFTVSSLTPAQRRAHERPLLERYAAALAGAGVTDYDLERCLADYRVATLFLVTRAVYVASRVEVEPRLDAFSKDVWRRLLAALDDLKVDGVSLPDSGSEQISVPAAVHRLIGVPRMTHDEKTDDELEEAHLSRLSAYVGVGGDRGNGQGPVVEASAPADAAPAAQAPAAATAPAGDDSGDGVGMRAVKLAGEALFPGTSLLLDGQLGSGAVHAVVGLLARMVLGVPGALLMGLNSYSLSTTDKNLLAHLRDSQDGQPATPSSARTDSLRAAVERAIDADCTEEEVVQSITEDVEDLYAEIKHARQRGQTH